MTSPAKNEHTPTPPLLPCPFCGSLFIKLNTIRDGATMACHDCMAQGPAKFSPNAREKSREAWNARVTAANSHADLHEALKGATIAANIAGSLLKEKDARNADLVKALEEIRQATIRECAAIAKAHKGSYRNKPNYKQFYKFASDEARQEIQAEQRGEDIASEIIEREILALSISTMGREELGVQS